MLLAEASEAVQIAGVWAGVIAAGISMVGVVLSAYLALRMAQVKAQADANATANMLNAVANEKNAFVAAQTRVELQEVKKATDGMKEQLVQEVKKAAFARGVLSEKDKAEASAPAAGSATHGAAVTGTGDAVSVLPPAGKEEEKK